jgi:methyl-accepting chemotaxis protein
MNTFVMSSSSIHDTKKKIDQSTIILDENTQKTIDSIKNIASNIREASNKARDTMRVLRQSGAINELTSAIQEAMFAARDTTREINETAKELRDRGVIRDTASTIDETTTAAYEIAENVKGTAQQVKEAAPETIETVKRASSGKKKKAK